AGRPAPVRAPKDKASPGRGRWDCSRCPKLPPVPVVSQNNTGRSDMRTMTLAVALVLTASCSGAAAGDGRDPITVEIEEAVARQEAKNALALARYGAPIETKSGAVEGSAHLLALLRRQLPATTALLGKDLADALLAQNTCPSLIVLADGDVPLARLTLAQSNF